jgi:hypothetical protein
MYHPTAEGFSAGNIVCLTPGLLLADVVAEVCWIGGVSGG